MNIANLPTLSIGNVSIRQHDGLYSLNDLHEASGGEENHKPVFFLRNKQTQSLISEISKSANLHFMKTTRGKYASTYACKELVIDYAAWISAEFHLKVIRVFLDTADKMSAHRPAELPPPPPTKTLTFTVPLGEIGHRWLLHTDRHGREHVTALSHDTHIGTPDKLVHTLMHAPADLHLSLDQQLTIASAFLRNAHQSAAGYAKRLKPLTGAAA